MLVIVLVDLKSPAETNISFVLASSYSTIEIKLSALLEADV
jgi:hypothetical protein